MAMTPEELQELLRNKANQEIDPMAEVPAETVAANLEEGELPEQPNMVDEFQTDELNDQAKSPYQKTNEELAQDQAPVNDRAEMLAKLKANILKQQERMDANKVDPADDKAMNWLTGIGQAANVYNEVSGVRDPKVAYWDDKQQKTQQGRAKELQKMYQDYLSKTKDSTSSATPITAYQKAQLEDKKADRELKKELAAAKPKETSFAEKEQIKADVKEKIAVAKENRKTRKDTENAISGIEDQIKSVKKARDLMKNASKSGLSDTGPIDQYTSKMSDRGQALEQAINQVSLDKMVKMFAGMSKAIDSDAERAFFQASQPAMNKYPAANLKILDDMLVNLESLKTKNMNLKGNITPKGERTDVAKPEKKEAMSIDPKIKGYADQYELSYEKAEQVLRSRGYNGKK